MPAWFPKAYFSNAKYGPYEERPYTEPMAPARDQREGPRGVNEITAEFDA